jgi:hypothetical protein
MTTGHEQVTGWFTGAIPDEWFAGSPDVQVDGEEILVVGALATPDVGADAGDEAREAAEAGRIKRFREETRDHRIRIAEDAEMRFRRKVSWGVRCGESEQLFTIAAVPVMTRLRMPERRVLDTLIAAGIARSRSEALAWCVRLVAKNESEWMSELRDAFAHVENVRSKGPKSTRDS